MSKLSFVIITCLTIIICSCNGKLDRIRKTFGMDQNKNRQQLHLVTIEPGFILNEDESVEDRRFIFLAKEETTMTTPGYMRKIILLDSLKQNISIEEDYFKNPVEKKYLIITHLFYTNSTSIVLQDIYDDPIVTQSIILNEMQADSVLKSWKVKPNPFDINHTE